MDRKRAALAAVLSCLMLTSTAGLSLAAEGHGTGTALEVERISDVPYLENPDGVTAALSIYAPVAPGPWPTVVMIHGGSGGYGAGILERWARAVAADGAVVFVPYHDGSPTWTTSADAVADITATIEQLACAVRFTRSEAGRYGGDPAAFSVFGHSAGANFASVIVLSDPAVSPGCLASADSAVPGTVVLFEGDWLLLGLPVYDRLLAEDRAVMDASTPWVHMPNAPRLPVTILDSGDQGLAIGTKERIDASLALRDPDGSLRAGLVRAGALEDDRLTETEAQRLLAEGLADEGYPVSFVELPDSTHEQLSEKALAMLTDALVLPSMDVGTDVHPSS